MDPRRGLSGLTLTGCPGWTTYGAGTPTSAVITPEKLDVVNSKRTRTCG